MIQPRYSARRLAVGFVLCAAVVLVPAWILPAVAGQGAVELERELVRWFHGWQGTSAFLDRLFQEGMALSAGWVMATLALLLAVLLWRANPTRATLPLVAYLGTLALHYLGKIVVGRPRPPFVDANPAYAAGSAYPSGHALEAAAVWGTVFYVLTRYAAAPLRRPAWVVFGLLVLFQGVNRLYFGVHWASDVLVGWAAGGLWGLTCIAAASGEPGPPVRLEESARASDGRAREGDG